ncbi:methylated-DNA--protein-cysteine methyltransferase [compost metagenome]
MKEMTEFSAAVISLIQKVPAGKIATYGQIAKLAGKPQGARGVAWILNSSSKAHKLPWQRILNSSGKISFPVDSAEYRKQRKLLENEGIVFGDNGQIDLKKFQWKKEVKVAKKKVSSKKPQMFS